VTRLLDGRHHLERFAMEQAGEVDYLTMPRRHRTLTGVQSCARDVALGRVQEMPD
jgi:hypothetical protein